LDEQVIIDLITGHSVCEIIPDQLHKPQSSKTCITSQPRKSQEKIYKINADLKLHIMGKFLVKSQHSKLKSFSYCLQQTKAKQKLNFLSNGEI